MNIRLTGATVAAFCMLGAGSAAADALEGKASPADVLAASAPSDWRTLDPENTLYIDLERGRVIVMLSSALAQDHVAQVKTLAREGFYDGLSFYRVIDGFVAQGGDPFEERDIGDAKPQLNAEFETPTPWTDKAQPYFLHDTDGYALNTGWIDSLPVGGDENAIWHLHCTGALAFGRNNEKDSASTEFYITLQPQRYLDRNLTVAGRVVQGMEHIQALRRVSPPESKDDDLGETIVSMRVAADLPEEDQAPLEIFHSGTEAFDAYIEARRNRPEAFFYYRPDHVNVCDVNVPVRPVSVE